LSVKLCRWPNLDSLIQDDLYSFIEDRLARSIPQFNVVISGFQAKLLELADWADVTAVNVDRRVLQTRVDFYLACGGGHCVGWSPGVVPAGIVPARCLVTVRPRSIIRSHDNRPPDDAGPDDHTLRGHRRSGHQRPNIATPAAFESHHILGSPPFPRDSQIFRYV